MSESSQEETRGFKVTLLFPLEDNAGRPFEEELWKWWRDRLTLLFGGFTEVGGVAGWWQGHSDQHRMLFLAVKGEQEVSAIRDFLREARPRFRQETMYLDYHQVHFELVV